MGKGLISILMVEYMKVNSGMEKDMATEPILFLTVIAGQGSSRMVNLMDKGPILIPMSQNMLVNTRKVRNMGKGPIPFLMDQVILVNTRMRWHEGRVLIY